MNGETISIIIPVYQAEKTLQRCLDSVLAQTYPDFLALVVNDGSTDRTARILEDYCRRDERIRVYHKENGGAASARNYALEMLDTKYVTFLDSDDWLDANALEELYRLLTSSGAQMAQCKFYYDHPNGEQYVPHDSFADGMVVDRKDFPQTVYKKMMAGIQMNHICHSLFYCSLLERMRLPENMVTGEDLYFLIDIFPRIKRFAYTAQPLYHYFRRADGLTGSSLGLMEKIRCNFILSHKISLSLKVWGMDTPWYHIKAYLRLPRVFVSKAYRMMRNLIMKLKKMR